MSGEITTLEPGQSQELCVHPGEAITVKADPEHSLTVQVIARDGTKIKATLAPGSVLHVEPPAVEQPLAPSGVISLFASPSAEEQPLVH